jgi:hypothetical protein
MREAARVVSLYHHGFALDERLEERLFAHKRSGAAPMDALPYPLPPYRRRP